MAELDAAGVEEIDALAGDTLGACRSFLALGALLTLRAL